MKVEGYWSLKNREASIQNKNIPFLNRLEEILRNNKINVIRRLLIKIKVPNSLSMNDIKTLKGFKEIKFHFEISPFDKSHKIVFNLPVKNEKLIIKLKNVVFPLHILLTKEEVLTKCILSSFGYLELRFWNIKFLRFLEQVSGKNNGKLRLTSKINLNNNFIISAFSALVDSEGSINFYGHTRRLRIRIKDKEYLEKWKYLLRGINIHSSITKDGNLFALTITGLEDFEKLIRANFELFQSERNRKFLNIIESYVRRQISRNAAKKYYLDKLKEERRPMTIKELSSILKKNRRTIHHYLKLLENDNKVTVDKTKKNYLYSVNNSLNP